MGTNVRSARCVVDNVMRNVSVTNLNTNAIEYNM